MKQYYWTTKHILLPLKKHKNARDIGILFSLMELLGLVPYNRDLTVSKEWFVRSSMSVASVVLFHVTFITYTLSRSTGSWKGLWAVLFRFNMYLVTTPALSYLFTLKYKASQLAVLMKETLVIIEKNHLFLKSPSVLTSLNLVCITTHVTVVALTAENSTLELISCFLTATQRVYVQSLSMNFCTHLEAIALAIQRNTNLFNLKPTNRLICLLEENSKLTGLARLCLLTFGGKIFFCVIVYGIGFGFHAYSLFIYFHYSLTYKLVTSMLIIYHILVVYFICLSCGNVNYQAEKFNSELFRLMRESKDLCKNEKLQLYVTMKQTVHFTACGFFTLGYPLVTSIIAAATTYLVILVQFSMPSK